MENPITTLAICSSSTIKKRLSDEERQATFDMLLKQSRNGVAKRGSLKIIANDYSVSVRTIKRIWKEAEKLSHGQPANISNKLVGRVGRKRIQINPNEVSTIPLRCRTNIRSLSSALNMSKSTVHRRIKEGFLRSHTNAIKPTLTDLNKIQRLKFCLSMVEPESYDNTQKFKGMLDYIHIDEKWFYMTKKSERYYLLPDEEEPLRTCKSKNFITKIMFLAEVACPRFDSAGSLLFSGKIGIFPFIFKEEAKRKSKNREAGTLETKPIVSITKDVVRECLIHKVLPPIRAKWPFNGSNETIFIQQDNANPHVSADH